MASENKYGQVEVPGIPDDEPIFIIRGRDVCAVAAIRAYGDEAASRGVSGAFLTSVADRATEIHLWQLKNNLLVKTPD